MAEPGAATDDTVVADVGKTVAVPNPTPSDAVELAWSQGDDRDDSADDKDRSEDIQNAPPATVRQSWRTTFGNAGALLLVGLVLAGTIVVGSWALTKGDSPTTAKPPSATKQDTTTAPSAATTTAAAPSIASTQDLDDKYLQALKDRGISFANPKAAIYNGKIVCQNLDHGMTVPQVVDAFRASSPAVGIDANTYVAISVHTYCPQYNDAVAEF